MKDLKKMEISTSPDGKLLVIANKSGRDRAVFCQLGIYAPQDRQHPARAAFIIGRKSTISLDASVTEVERVVNIPKDCDDQAEFVIENLACLYAGGNAEPEIDESEADEPETKKSPVTRRHDIDGKFRLFDMIKAGKPVREIAAATGVSEHNVTSWKANLRLFENPNKYKRGPMLHAWAKGKDFADRKRLVAEANPAAAENYVKAFVSQMNLISEWRQQSA